MTWKWWLIILWFIYLISPIDVIPDRIPWAGRVDDLLLLGYIYWNYFRKNSGSGQTNERVGQGDSKNKGDNRAERPREVRDPWIILGVRPPVSVDEIKHAYRTQAAQYHPDKVAHLGPELQELAREKFLEIQWAYEELVREQPKSGRS